MRVFRFDEELSAPVSEFGSLFRICPLASGGGGVRVDVVHVPPGGRIGRHPAAKQQLIAVVSGSGWVAGADAGRRRGIEAGVAVLSEGGEAHEAGSEAGFTAIVVEGAFVPEARVVTREIVVTDYDEAWPEWFAMLHDRLWPLVADLAVCIDHVGSTAVPGLPAKPVIDLDIVVADAGAIPAVISRLRELGYRWEGDLGIPGREAFRLRSADPGGSSAAAWPEHNLYAVVENNRSHLDHVLLRDLLRADTEARRRYGELKRRNVELARGDMDVYVAAKAALVAELLTRARSERGLPPVEYWLPEP